MDEGVKILALLSALCSTFVGKLCTWAQNKLMVGLSKTLYRNLHKKICNIVSVQFKYVSFTFSYEGFK